MKLAVIGDPVAHSRSPELHRGFMEEEGIDGSYTAIRIPKGKVAQAFRAMQAERYFGCNVTYPLKEEAAAACDELDEDAQQIGAINTVLFTYAADGTSRIRGTNTDGIGARTALEEILGSSVSLSRIGILGYGATARAILAELGENDAYTFVWGRDPEKITGVCKRFDAQPWPHDNPPGIVISTLPPEVPLPSDLTDEIGAADIVMDTNYGTRSTLGLLLHREVIPGDAMLTAQARASFDFWLSHLP